MEPEKVRAVAITAAAFYSGALGRGTPRHVVFAADVFAAYVRDGSDAALAICDWDGSASSDPRTAEAPEAADPPRAPVANVGGDTGGAISNPERSAGNSAALRSIESGRRERAQGLLKEMRAAKTEGEQRGVIQKMNSAGLADLKVRIKNVEQLFGPYLTSLQGS